MHSEALFLHPPPHLSHAFLRVLAILGFPEACKNAEIVFGPHTEQCKNAGMARAPFQGARKNAGIVKRYSTETCKNAIKEPLQGP